MSTPHWQSMALGVLYSVQFEPELNHQVVIRIAQAIIKQPLFDSTTAENYAAIVAALDTDAHLTKVIPEPHNDIEFRDFLRRVLAELDASRPWPQPPQQRPDVA